MNVSVLLFAILREKAGVGRVELELPEESTVRDAVARVCELFPQLGPAVRHIAYALNRDYAQADAGLRPGDELALIPPVSGG